MFDFEALPEEIQHMIKTIVLRDKLVSQGRLWKVRTMDRKLRYVPKPKYNSYSARLYNVRPPLRCCY